jgi:hypothetical protein
LIFYLTYNDAPSGIYSSQVVDVVKYINHDLKTNLKLVSFISLRGFSANKKKIRLELSTALVVPMFPGIHRWRLNVVLLTILTIIYRPKAIIGRSVLATQLALKVKNRTSVKQVVYDGRGAISPEWKEYGVVTHPKMLGEIDELENEVITKSDFRIAVSEELVKFWQARYQYKSNMHVVIPCTLNHIFEQADRSESTIKKARDLFGFTGDDKVFIYSGSIAGWQSFELLNVFLENNLNISANHKVLFLSDMDKHISKLQHQFPGQVFNKKVLQADVPFYLMAGNYGILIREQSVTNQVASPVKFAEYLCSGLGVVISHNLGDYSRFVVEKQCGTLSNAFAYPAFSRSHLTKVALTTFTKKSHASSYHLLISHLTG